MPKMSYPHTIIGVSKKVGTMPKYYVKMKIDFAGEIEADSREDAEAKAWTSWGDTMDSEITYDGVYDIDVEEPEEDEDEEDE
jgi:hypothetical protein